MLSDQKTPVFFFMHQKNHEKLTVRRRVNPYGQPDRKISVFYDIPILGEKMGLLDIQMSVLVFLLYFIFKRVFLFCFIFHIQIIVFVRALGRKITTIADAENQCYRCHQWNEGTPQN